MDLWQEPVPVTFAERVLGVMHFWWAVAQGGAYCAVKASDAWAANLSERYAAYKCAETTALQRAVARPV
jgi:hypothetical protein